MRIDWNETICGLSMLQVRDVINRIGGGVYRESAGARMGLPQDAAETLLLEFIKRGWVERATESHRPDFLPTIAGSAVGMAKKLKPLLRPQATALLDRVLAAAEEVNGDPRYAFDVKSLGVFGSYLGESHELNDLDIVFELDGRWNPGVDGSFMAAVDRSNAAFPLGRSFFDQLDAPRKIVVRRLKVSNRVSPHELQEIQGLGWSYQVVMSLGSRTG